MLTNLQSSGKIVIDYPVVCDVLFNVDVDPEFMGRAVVSAAFFLLFTHSMALFTQGFIGSAQMKRPLTVLNKMALIWQMPAFCVM